MKQDYYPFGMLMPGRIYSSATYRYGFNGQEKDDEVKGNGNNTTAQFWEYDTRIGRRWNIDPKPITGVSLYVTFNNNSICFYDRLGDSSLFDNRGNTLWYDKTDKDLRVFMKDGDQISQIGTLGDKIDINTIAKNIISDNTKTSEKMTAEAEWVSKVLPKEEWDYKNRKNTLFGVAWDYDEGEIKAGKTLWHTDFSYKNYTFKGSADFGNYHAGYMGTMAGVSRISQFRWAGLGEVVKGHDVERRLKEILTNTPPYGDQPRDHWFNKAGMDDADKVKKPRAPAKQMEDLWMEYPGF